MSGEPPFRHVFKLTDGETLICSPGEAKRVVDERSQWEGPQVVWEVKQPDLPLKRFWPDEIVWWRLEELKPIKELKAEEA